MTFALHDESHRNSRAIAVAICPSCHAVGPIDIGRIPNSNGLGIGAKRLTKGGNLYRRRRCELFFKLPRYGFELNLAAGAKAATKRAVVLGQDVFADLQAVTLKFDVITAFDVIEHVEEPVRFLGILADKLKPGGEIIISTGNTNARSWRFLGSRYWYCSYPEHIVFINPAWATGAAEGLGVCSFQPPGWSTAKDHMLFRFRKNDQ